MLKRTSTATKTRAVSSDLVLSNVGRSLVPADKGFAITYVNPEPERLFAELEADLRRDVPGFDATRTARAFSVAELATRRPTARTDQGATKAHVEQPSSFDETRLDRL